MPMPTAAGGYYPPVGFHFSVDFGLIGNDNDVRFQTVSGLTMEYDIESFKEGGENRFEHRLPVRTKYPDLVLKRGYLSDSGVIRWCLEAFQNRIFVPVDVLVSLLDERHDRLKTWTVIRAWPRKWSVSDFNAQESSLVIETLELSYSYFTVS